MNIFVLSRDAREAALFHCNKHVIKMILESAQMLCAAHWIHLLKKEGKSLKDFARVKDAQSWLYENTDVSLHPPWKLTHSRHPCTLWTCENISNYMWHSRLGENLLKEYTRRYGKRHKSEIVHEWLNENSPVDIKNKALTKWPLCMPDECKVSKDAVTSYRNYYKKYKNNIAVWEPRAHTPKWFVEKEQESTLCLI